MDSFILYRTELDILLALKSREGMAVLRALMTGEADIRLSPMADAVFRHMKEHTDRDKDAYERQKQQTIERMRRYRERKKAQNDDGYVTLRNVTRNVNDNVNVNVNDNDNDKVNDNAKDNAKGNDYAKENVPPVVMEEEREREEAGAAAPDREQQEQQEEKERRAREVFRSQWNSLVSGTPIPPLLRMTDRRWEAARECRAQFSWDEMQQAIRNASLSPAMTGRTRTKFLATYDWLMRPDNLLKCLEGNFKAR